MDFRHLTPKGGRGTPSSFAVPADLSSGMRAELSAGFGKPVDAMGAADSRTQGRDGQPLVSVTGYVLPDAWGAQYEVAGVLIADDRERELVVDNVADHPAMLNLCRRKVTATGWLTAREGRLLFTVRDYAVVDAAG